MDNRPIGVFDSGIGGLTVLGAIHRLMPAEDLIYFGDSGRAPYGTKSVDTVRKYTFQDINFLLKHDVKMIVIACNTASACSLESVLKSYGGLPVEEVVGPGSKVAVRLTKNGKIGVIGTPATVSSGVYERAIKKIREDSEIYAKACPLFVPLVEEGWWEGDVPEKVAEKYLAEVKDAGVDTLILGCTHYPYLEKVIAGYMGKNVKIINSGLAVAESVKSKLETADILHEEKGEGRVIYFTSDSVAKFTSLGNMFLDKEPDPVEHADIESIKTEPEKI